MSLWNIRKGRFDGFGLMKSLILQALYLETEHARFCSSIQVAAYPGEHSEPSYPQQSSLGSPSQAQGYTLAGFPMPGYYPPKQATLGSSLPYFPTSAYSRESAPGPSVARTHALATMAPTAHAMQTVRMPMPVITLFLSAPYRGPTMTRSPA